MKYKYKTVSVSNVSLQSEWVNEQKPSGRIERISTPTMDTQTKTVNLGLSSGYTIAQIAVSFSVNKPKTGISALLVNNVEWRKGKAVKLSWDNNRSLTLTFAFRANGDESEDGTDNSVLQISNIKAKVKYSKTVQDTASLENSLTKAPQAVVILNMENEEYYLFDGVTKVSYSYSSKFDDDPESDEAAEYVNTAKNEQDKVTLDVVMSDVHQLESYLTKYAGDTVYSGERDVATKFLADYKQVAFSRSSRALQKLYHIKHDRKKLMILARNNWHRDMILAEVTVNQDENYPFGWEGQLVFKSKLTSSSSSSDSSSSGSSGTDKYGYRRRTSASDWLDEDSDGDNPIEMDTPVVS